MLVTNQTISSKEDVMTVERPYFSRWRIEEYFRCKKHKQQHLSKTRLVSAITGWRKTSEAYCRMRKKVSDFGSVQNVQSTVSFTSIRPFKQIKEYFSQSPVPAGLIKVPLFTEHPLIIILKMADRFLGQYFYFAITFNGNSRYPH